ncbi:HEPN domain-containing protein [Pantoea agglomerans]|uniref:HEPN domain-containing protein n=1 Tax=Enterobacter agglomerans TaxID=549 RepID=UPI00320AA0B9
MASPKDIFDDAWLRCDVLAIAYSHASKNFTGAFKAEEILRAEWVARVSALDLFIHEIIAQNMLLIFQKNKSASSGYNKFTLPHRVVDSIRDPNSTPTDAERFFDLEIRRQLGFQTYQHPKNIADGIKYISNIELWNSVALYNGATSKTMQTQAGNVRNQLEAIVDRRNKIAHEGDMQPSVPRTPWPINHGQLATVRDFINSLVISIDAIV